MMVVVVVYQCELSPTVVINKAYSSYRCRRACFSGRDRVKSDRTRC